MTLQWPKNPAEKNHERMVRVVPPTSDQGAIKAYCAGSGPDVEPKTLDDLLAGIASVRSRLREIEFCEVFAHPDSIKESFHQRNPSKGRDRLVTIFEG